MNEQILSGMAVIPRVFHIVSNRCIGRMHTTKYLASSSFTIPPSVQGEPAATKKNKAKQNDDVKDRELWVPPGQQVLQNGNAECPREQSRVQACEKAKRQERRAQELQGCSGKRRGNRRREVHLGDFLSESPGRAVLKIGQTAFEFMQAVNVEDHGSDGCPKDEVSPSGHGGGRVGVEGFS